MNKNDSINKIDKLTTTSNQETNSQSSSKKLDDYTFRIITSHTFIKEAKTLLTDHMENDTELDTKKLFFLLERAKHLLNDLQEDALKNLK